MRILLQAQICALFVLLPFISLAQKQSLTYQGFKGDDYIGDMIVSKKVEGNKVSFTSDAQLNVRFLLNWKLRFFYEVEYINGNLHRSLVQISRDGKLRTEVTGKRAGSHYLSDVDGDQVKLDAPLIDYCVLNTYFEAPKGKKRFFSERWGEYLEVAEKGEGRFILTPPNGSHNTLIYKNGHIQELQFNHSLASVKFVLKE
ncbi:MAG: DUF6134 family protein [Bacteroidota bacterium]